MKIVCVHQLGGWHGYCVNNRNRVTFSTGSMPSEFLARRAANLWLLKQQGRDA